MNTTIDIPASPPDRRLAVEFCGEWFPVDPSRPFTIGREGDLVVDENPFLHRHLLELRHSDGIWILSNIGSRLAVTVSDGAGRLQSWLAPGGRLPLVFGRTTIVFTAGPTTYDLGVHVPDPLFVDTHPRSSCEGTTTIGDIALTDSQKLAILALAEPMLIRESTGRGEVPSSAAAARRLGWAVSRFNRKLDNVCDKLDRLGVQGLRGEAGTQALGRRTRLVEYAVAARLVTRTDLPLLDSTEDAR